MLGGCCASLTLLILLRLLLPLPKLPTARPQRGATAAALGPRELPLQQRAEHEWEGGVVRAGVDDDGAGRAAVGAGGRARGVQAVVAGGPAGRTPGGPAGGGCNFASFLVSYRLAKRFSL